jgi:tripeptidyl-peptidase-1
LTFAAVAPYVPNGTHPTLNGIDGGVAPFFYDGYQYIGVESLLDMSIIFPLIHPQQAILYQVDDFKEAELSQGFGDTFLDALDAVSSPPASITWTLTDICESHTAHSKAATIQP